MKHIRVGINGFGRIGRTLFRALSERATIEVVAINDLADTKTLAHLLKYDSIHGIFPGKITYDTENLMVNGTTIRLFTEREPGNIPWGKHNVDIVVESTGLFRTHDTASQHLEGGAKKVILSAPPKSEGIKTVVLGINDHILDGTETLISNASCTTNCAAPMVKVIDELCGIEQAYITTVHSYTGDQRLHDAPHSDLRRARSAPNSIVPTTTGAAKAIAKIFPHLEGKTGGCGIRVPVPDGSLTDITFTVRNSMDQKQINKAFEKAAQNELKGILAYTDEPIVSIDIVGNPHSLYLRRRPYFCHRKYGKNSGLVR